MEYWYLGGISWSMTGDWRKVLGRLEGSGMTLNKRMCEFRVRR